ncbi:MAG TPA: hypothetical protein VMB18_06740 [Terriglobales bacterium]|nr:hypothetical protein [Terriglobales bacterium]
MQSVGPKSWNSVATKHLFFRIYNDTTYEPQMMRDEHRQWIDSQLRVDPVTTELKTLREFTFGKLFGR